jgi:hypothetical protein
MRGRERGRERGRGREREREGGCERTREGEREGGRERGRENAREEAPRAGGPELLVEIFEDDVIVPNHVHDGRSRRRGVLLAPAPCVVVDAPRVLALRLVPGVRRIKGSGRSKRW